MGWFSDYARLLRAGFSLARHDVVLPGEYRSRLPGPARLFGGVMRTFAGGSRGRPGERLATALEGLGPAYIKLGQFLATRPDVFGRDVTDDLSRLKDDLPPASVEKAQKVLTDAFGSEAEALFGALEPAIAAASIAQVHKVQTKDGPRAVKILRPGIEAVMAKDISAMRRGAKIIQDRAPEARRLEPVAFVDVVSAALERETDLRIEAGAADAFSKLEDVGVYFDAPKVDWTRTDKAVATFSWIDGKSLTDPTALDGMSEVKRAQLANHVTRGFLVSALDHGYFHADMHEGNMILTPAGKLALVDFGIMGRINPAERRYLAEILYGFIQRDYDRIAEVHFEAGYVPADKSVEDFAIALRSVGEPIWDKSADEVSMGRLLLQLFDITHLFGMRLRPELVLLQKTMVQVEGVARAIDAKHHIWTAAKPIVERWVRRELGPQAKARDTLEGLRIIGRRLSKLPETGATKPSGAITLSDESIQALAAALRPKPSVPWLGVLLGLIVAAAAAFLIVDRFW